ncbi:MAG: ABC transporter permease [bacterium]|jgi:ABC-type uncharacterized transport system permease subunit
MNESLLVALLVSAVTAGTPLLFASLGEVLAQRSGVMNLGVEGMMLVGAVTGFLVATKAHSLWLGILAAMLAGGAIALIHAFLTITLKANQVVSGLALTLFGTGLSAYVGRSMIGVPAFSYFRPLKLGFLGDVPFLGPVLFNQNALVYISFVITPLLWLFVYKTRPGLYLRSVGENPAAADAMGINVFAVRYLAVFTGGMLAGLGGAYLSLAYAPSWLENMTAGRGWIAVALVIFATWNPLKAASGAYLFGGIDALGYRLQAAGITTSSYFLKSLPYIFTIVALIIASTHSRGGDGPPAGLGQPYDREER